MTFAEWACEARLEYGFLQKGNDIFLVTRAVDQVDLKQLYVNSLGLYFGELRNEELRVSIEGSQIIGHEAKKNVIVLNDEQLQQWLAGTDIELIENVSANTTGGKNSGTTMRENNGYVLVKHNNDFFGCGRIKNGNLLNFVPKSRRIK